MAPVCVCWGGRCAQQRRLVFCFRWFIRRLETHQKACIAFFVLVAALDFFVLQMPIKPNGLVVRPIPVIHHGIAQCGMAWEPPLPTFIPDISIGSVMVPP